MDCEKQCGESNLESLLEFATPLQPYRLADDSSVELEIAKAVTSRCPEPLVFGTRDAQRIGEVVAEAILAYRKRIDEAEVEEEGNA